MLRKGWSGLHKYDHVSHYRFVIGWLPVSSVIQYRSLVTMYKHYRCNPCLLLNLQIKYGRHSSYHTRTQASFANIFWYNSSYSKSFFDQRQQTGGIIYQKFSLVAQQLCFYVNYIMIYYIPDCLYNFVMLFVFVYCLCYI